MNNNRIGVIGCGRLGLSFALLAEHCGYEVVGADVRAGYVQSLVLGTYRTSEPFINEWLPHTKNFSCSISTRQVVSTCDILFCFVATPSLPDGSYDHSAIDRVVADIQELHVQGIQMDNKILVIGCTTMPGYCDTVQSRLDSTGISVVYNPEFIAQGSIIQGLREADMVLIGTEDTAAFEVLYKVYSTIMGTSPKINMMSRTAAEITKISINCFLAIKIAYANMVGDIATSSKVGNEVDTILQAIGDDSRIGHKYLGYGFGYGGPCIPRDGKALRQHAVQVGIMPFLTIAADSSNNVHADYLKSYYIRMNPDKNIPYIFTQLTYKKGVDILTESQQYRLCKDLLQAGYKVDITESQAVIIQVKQELSQYSDRITYGTIISGYKIGL